MPSRIISTLLLGSALIAACRLGWSQDAPPALGQHDGQGRGSNRGGGMMWGMGRGTIGTVTAVAADRFSIKTELGEAYTIFFSVNTRIMKQPPGQSGQRRRGSGGGDAGDSAQRTPPQAIKPTEIKAGDVITAGGEVDTNAKTVGAVFIMLVDPERAKEMRAMEANYGKTWLMGRVTAINEVKVTLEGGLDHAEQSFVADENTTFRKRRDPITLADLQVGDMVRVEGAVKDGTFLATAVSDMGVPPNRDGVSPQPAPQ